MNEQYNFYYIKSRYIWTQLTPPTSATLALRPPSRTPMLTIGVLIPTTQALELTARTSSLTARAPDTITCAPGINHLCLLLDHQSSWLGHESATSAPPWTNYHRLSRVYCNDHIDVLHRPSALEHRVRGAPNPSLAFIFYAWALTSWCIPDQFRS